MTRIKQTSRKLKILLLASLLIALLTGSLYAWDLVWAKAQPAVNTQASPLHPTFALLDAQGINVLESGGAVSTMQTCGACHDTAYIEGHSYHTSAGLNEFTAPGEVPGGHAWDTSPGWFGKWNPLIYRYLSPAGDALLDLGTADWLRTLGTRHVGGGPATTSRDGQPLADLAAASGNPETSVLDPATGEPVAWDWQASGVVEMNCFLCHTPEPNNTARTAALQTGAFAWANTATLLGSGLVEQAGETYTWNPAAFQPNGELNSDFVVIQDPTNENCGQCHGLVHDDLQEPLVRAGCSAETFRTETTGQIISGQRLSETGMNLAGKEDLTRSWDIHAERLVSCTDCHFALNNPVYFQENEATQPAHLTFDPRRLEIGEYLYQPEHNFARGQSAQTTVAAQYKDTMRRCESCHSIAATHNWLPYKERHTAAVACESCHIPRLYSTAIRQYDWTTITTESTAQTACRGIVGESDKLTALVTGYEPVLMPRQEVDGKVRLAPYNLVTAWYWVYGDPPRPVRLVDLQSAWLLGDAYHPAVLATFDANGDGALDPQESAIDTPEKESLIAARLAALGLENPRITGEIQPYSINHDVANGDWAIDDCQTCHSADSRVYQPIQLASYVPAGVLPSFVNDANTIADGQVYSDADGELYYQPAGLEDELYVLGRDRRAWVDLLGTLLFAGVLAGISAHGGLRFMAALRRPKGEPEVERVYMYTVYERFWHWLQTFTIVLLLFTGLIIHKPDTFGIFSFRGVVLTHNILAAILVANAFLSLFYHLVSGEIKQYIPRPAGFFDQAIVQSLYYLRGIFKRAPHPFEKTPQKKLNPLQQITYFGILNVLLPLQIITGALIWGAQRWPEIARALGGLPFLGPFHTLVAWLFASFIVGHVYLTTTGHTPLAGIKSMMFGWDELETHAPAGEEPVA